MPDTRSITLVDIPLVKRLSSQGMVLDSEAGLTRDARGPNSALLSSLLFPQLGLHTLVARSDEQHVVGQFRTRPDDPNAHIVYIAPRLESEDEDTAWLHILDAMAREAGKHKAHSLVAEVEEDSYLFETMRTAGFAVYTRQAIWRRHAGCPVPEREPVELIEAGDEHMAGIHALYCATTPSMVQQVAVPPGDMDILIYRKQERIEGFLALSEGKQGVYLIPYLHPDDIGKAAAIIEAAIQHADRAGKVPVYVCARRYQSWLDSILERMSFEPWIQQAVMVKHIAAGVRQHHFAPILSRRHKEAHTIPPPGNHMTQV